MLGGPIEMKRGWVFLFAATLAIVLAMLAMSFDRLAIYILAEHYALEASFKKAGGLFRYRELNVFDKKTGLGMLAAEARFKPAWDKKPVLDFELKSVSFIRNKARGADAGTDTITTLVAMPFEGRWVYREVAGRIIPLGNGIRIQKLSATSDDIRLLLSGIVYNNSSINCDMEIHFSSGAMTRIPDELSNVLLADEKDGWKSISVHLEGNYKKPSIRISSKRFRLNIRTITGP
jgi:hypothetical protein